MSQAASPPRVPRPPSTALRSSEHCKGHRGQQPVPPQGHSRTEWGRGPGSGPAEKARGRGWGLDVTLSELPGWAAAVISLEFLLEHSCQICADPVTCSLGPSGTGSAHQSVGQMARAFAAWLGRETMVLRGPVWTRGKASNPQTVPIAGERRGELPAVLLPAFLARPQINTLMQTAAPRANIHTLPRIHTHRRAPSTVLP